MKCCKEDFFCHVDAVFDEYVLKPTQILSLNFLNPTAGTQSVGPCYYCFLSPKTVSYQALPTHTGHSINTVDRLTKPELYVHNDLPFILCVLTGNIWGNCQGDFYLLRKNSCYL